MNTSLAFCLSPPPMQSISSSSLDLIPPSEVSLCPDMKTSKFANKYFIVEECRERGGNFHRKCLMETSGSAMSDDLADGTQQVNIARVSVAAKCSSLPFLMI